MFHPAAARLAVSTSGYLIWLSGAYGEEHYRIQGSLGTALTQRLDDVES